MKKIHGVFLILTLAGCAGRVDYVRPSHQTVAPNNFKIIDKPRDAVWSTSIPALGKQFFVINNLDKSSGLINVSYNGNPERYIDCGRVTSYVQNARGERTYNFAGASPQQHYEVMTGGRLFGVDRRLSLEGRVNLIFEEISENRTKVTASTRYVVQRQLTVTPVATNIPHTTSDIISLNSGSSAAFAPNPAGQSTECTATGALESEILSTIN